MHKVDGRFLYGLLGSSSALCPRESGTLDVLHRSTRMPSLVFVKLLNFLKSEKNRTKPSQKGANLRTMALLPSSHHFAEPCCMPLCANNNVMSLVRAAHESSFLCIYFFQLMWNVFRFAILIRAPFANRPTPRTDGWHTKWRRAPRDMAHIENSSFVNPQNSRTLHMFSRALCPSVLKVVGSINVEWRFFSF